MVKLPNFISGLAGNLMVPDLPVGFSYLFLKESLLGIGIFHCLAVKEEIHFYISPSSISNIKFLVLI